MSSELKTFLCQKGVATSRTASYNPAGNGQVERLNNTLWKTIMLILRSRKLSITYWQFVLDDALHSIRSLLCTATNCTPHERLFNYQRRSTNGTAVPTRLLTPGPILLKRRNRSNKYDALVQEVELIEANPQYAHVRYPNGREDTVATKYLAPAGERLPHKSLGQQSTDADNMDDVKSTHEEEHAPTPNIRDNNVTLPGNANNDIPLTDSPERESVSHKCIINNLLFSWIINNLLYSVSHKCI